MWNRRLRSNTAAFPTHRDVVATLIDQLVRQDSKGSWAHIERVKKQGWLSRFLSNGYRPYLEVLLSYDRVFEVNASAIEGHRFATVWREKDNLFQIPISDQDKLVDHILASLCLPNAEPYHLEGWIAGS